MQVELHRHLDASFRPATLLELAQVGGFEAQSTSLEAFKEKFLLRQPFGDLNQVLAEFALFQKVLDRPEVLERVAFEAVLDCALEGTHAVELRFSPSFVCGHSKLAWHDALDAFEAGMRRGLRARPGMQAGLICIASRENGMDSVADTVEFFVKYQSRFIGLDLAGDEKAARVRDYRQAFQPAIDGQANITIHAGEESEPDNIWDAIDDLKAKRIGHGILAARDQDLMKYLGENQICLEVCPSSNWVTRCVPSLGEHPLPDLLRAGVPVSINTDDPGIFGVTLADEFAVCQKHMGLTDEELQRCRKSAAAASFLNI